MKPISGSESGVQELAITSDSDVVRVRQAVRTLTIQAKFSIIDQTKIVTAASELARNTLIHGKGGSALLELLHERGKMGVRAAFVDSGPGISDINQAMTEGYTSGGGLGLGLPGSRRLVDAFELQTEPGVGTCITVIKWKR